MVCYHEQLQYDQDKKWGECIGMTCKLNLTSLEPRNAVLLGPAVDETCSPKHIYLTNHTSPGIPTLNGNAGGAVCVFPFLYKDEQYSKCTTTEHNRPWCATTSNHDRDKKWGDCTDVPTINGNSRGAACVFPFMYRGKLYWECTTVHHGKPWCSTTSSFDQNGMWGECMSAALNRPCGSQFFYCFNKK
ncbi:matrix metalloproteinase-9-like [Sardina pilchardus]|uniref:matrix metalloproteinase-9-like n=1 Tax=Sardina pilchardus TaxID=27697 RepID=UPI002E1425B7